MNELDAARLDLMRAVERFVRACGLAEDTRVVTDVVAVARHTDGRGETYGRALIGTTGFRDVPLDQAIDMLEDGFMQAWDLRAEAHGPG